MDRLLDILLGRQSSDGVERALAYNPPAWMAGHARLVNTLLIVAVVAIVIAIYRREGKRLFAKVGLGAVRLLIFLFVIMLLNRPVIRETRIRVEPSVVAILVDRSISMWVHDVNPDGTPADHSVAAGPPAAGPTTSPALATGAAPQSRLQAVFDLLDSDNQSLLRKLASVHTLHLYAFDSNAREVASTAGPAPVIGAAGPTALSPDFVAAEQSLRPDNDVAKLGNTTQVIPSLLTVLENLQGQRLAGVVVITDGHETPTSPQADLDRLRRYPAKIYPVTVGSTKPPQNLTLASVSMQDSVFKDDVVSAKVTVRGTGYPKDHTIRLTLRDKKTGIPFRGPDGKPTEKLIVLPDDKPVEEELIFRPEKVGTLEGEAIIEPQPGELDDKDNARPISLAVLDATINVLYVDGYPRWEYRYIKNEMIRDKTVNISCLLTSATAGFPQEGDRPVPDFGPNDPRTGEQFPGPITRFPETMDELMKYDVVIFGDVDPRQFTDRQLQIVSDFVSKKGGGFGMVSGPRFAPIAYRNSPVEQMLPVNTANVQPEDPGAEYSDGWRPVITDEGRRGEASTIFRFFIDPKANEKFLREDLQPLFWFCAGVTTKAGGTGGLVYAEHPVITGANGRKVPLLVLGRFGAGRTMFSGVDDTWRWRFYTGESVFDTYWVQQMRYLARSRKLGQRRITFSASKDTYELNDQIKLELKVLDPLLLQDLAPQIRVDVVNPTGQTVSQVTLVRQESPNDDTYLANLNAGALGIGSFVIKLPALSEKQPALTQPIEVIVPRLELADPTVDTAMLNKLSPEQVIPLADARAKLPDLLHSAAKNIPVPSTFPLWDLFLSPSWQFPIALGIFVLLLTVEWVLRKVFGML